MNKFKLFALVLTVFLAFAGTARAQGTTVPALPDPIQNLVDEGAQIRYLGKDNGLDAWLTIKNGQEQYFYVLPDQSAFVMGVLFDKTGKAITVDQVRRLRAQGDNVLDSLADNFMPTEQAAPQEPESSFAFKTPAEKLFSDIEGANWVPLGNKDAPIVYALIDTQCPHCHAFMNDMRQGKYIDNGQVQIRMIPVGFREETVAQAAFLLAAPNPQETWFKHLDGDTAALPAKTDINDQGVQKNLAVMQAWKFDVTPVIFYRAKDGSVKIVRGRPKDPAALVSDVRPQ